MTWVIVYTLKNGKEEVFPIRSAIAEKHERAAAERELHSKGTHIVGYHFEEREDQKEKNDENTAH
jgi:hypothetical protein